MGSTAQICTIRKKEEAVKMKLSVLILAVLVVVALIAIEEVQGKKKPKPGPCRVKNCKKCNVSGKKCKVCNTGMKAKAGGKKCKPKPCFVNPCQNGGQCIAAKKGVEKCVCPADIYGDRCEIVPEPADPCSPNPCQNGGACSGGSCICKGGFTGATCQTNPCVPNPCNNGGVCSAGGSCSCPAGYLGGQCQTKDPNYKSIVEAIFPYGKFVMPGGNQLLFNWNNGRPQAYGTLDQSGSVHRGSFTFPDDRTFTLSYYPADRDIYWNGDKGQTGIKWLGV